jgi:hypothetical protein
MNKVLKVYVIDSTGEFESIKDKINASISQFDVEFETKSPTNLKQQ